MADVSDVETALRDKVTSIVYPDGQNQPSIIGSDVRIFRGYPLPKNLDSDLANGIVNISVDAIRGMYKALPQYMREWQTVGTITPSLTATVSGNTITIGGTILLPQSVMTIVNGFGYPYVVQTGDTLDTIASGIAAIVPNATAIDNIVTLSEFHSLAVNIGVKANTEMEVKRQEQIFGVTIWVTTDNNGFAVRDSLCSQIDSQLSFLILLPLADGSKGNIHCNTGLSSDNMQKEKALWRSLYYAVNYPTTISQEYYTVTDTISTLSLNYDT